MKGSFGSSPVRKHKEGRRTAMEVSGALDDELGTLPVQFRQLELASL
jgi:hypothetical protein